MLLNKLNNIIDKPTTPFIDTPFAKPKAQRYSDLTKK